MPGGLHKNAKSVRVVDVIVGGENGWNQTGASKYGFFDAVEKIIVNLSVYTNRSLLGY